ncbi:MAG: TolC family protein, partial [Elusimicrobiota bacterium]|nr:TolC family protein [Elusimicrobiota bacterium]
MTNIKISALSTVMVFCAVFAGALSVAAPAQQDAGAFTLDGYIRAYIKNSPAVVQDSNALKTAEIAYQNQTINLFLPSSGASAGATPLTKGESPHFDGPYDAGLYVNWNIFNSGRDYLAYIKAKNTLQTARMRFKNAMQDRVLAAINLFYKFQLQEKLLESARRDLADKREQYEFTSLLYRDGQKSYTEMLYSENNLKDSELRMARAEADFASSLMSFNNAVSRAADAPAKLDYELEETDAPQDASYDEDLQTAVKNREDINSAILRLHNAQIDRKLTLINNFPSLTADFSFNNNTRDVFGARQND